MDKKNHLNDLMREGMDKVRAMVDTNAIVGQPISTPDGVTLIPISRASMGFGGGGHVRAAGCTIIANDMDEVVEIISSAVAKKI